MAPGVEQTVADAFNGLSEKPTRDAVNAALRRLAEAARGRSLPDRTSLRYEAADQLKALGVASGEAGDLVRAALHEGSAASRPDQLQGTVTDFDDPEPWAGPVDGAELLDEIVSVIRRYVVLPAHAAETVALWALMTYCLDYAAVAVRLILTSPTRECGKTRLLTILWALVRRALPASSISPAALFRVIEAHGPTPLLDEMDNARLKENDEQRALLNSGHTRGTAFVIRTVGDDHKARSFSTWCAIALAAIGDLPDTVMSRGIILKLHRKPRNERVVRLRESRLHAELEPVRRKLTRWAADYGPRIADTDTEPPDALDGREAENWSVLIALADAAGGMWPERARRAALSFAGEAEEGEGAPGILLLADLRELFAERETDRLASEEIVVALAKLEGRPWPEWRDGNPITPRGVARLLKPFGIEPQQVRFDNMTRKGYLREWFEDAWSRYSSPDSKQAKQATNDTASAVFSEGKQDSNVSDRKSAPDPHKQRSVSDVSDTEGLGVGAGTSPAGGHADAPDTCADHVAARQENRDESPPIIRHEGVRGPRP